MKKQYINPEVEIIAAESTQLLTNSLDLLENEVNEPLSRDEFELEF